jgi:hypothetical protein
METWEKYRFTSAECKIWQMYEAYYFQSKKRGDFRKYLPTQVDPRNSKNWKYFEQAYDNFSQDSVFDPYIFMEAQFRNVPKGKTVFPAQLKTKTAVERYRAHREALKVKDFSSNTTVIMEGLAATLIFLRGWWKRKNLPQHSYAEFFKRIENEMLSEGMLFCLQRMVSKYFMAISVHFNEEYKRLDSDMKLEILPPQELKSYRIKMMLNKEAYDFAKELFGREIT